MTNKSEFEQRFPIEPYSVHGVTSDGIRDYRRKGWLEAHKNFEDKIQEVMESLEICDIPKEVFALLEYTNEEIKALTK